MMPRQEPPGVVTKTSARPVPATLERLRAAVERMGLMVFVLVDHSGEAARAGLSMPDTKLLIFGSPAGGTPIMLAAPLAALDLPLKVLVWEDPAGGSFVSYVDPAYFAASVRWYLHQSLLRHPSTSSSEQSGAIGAVTARGAATEHEWDADRLRSTFLAFFAERGHVIVPSASLIPEGDPSVLFTTAGVHPLLPYLLGRPHPAGKLLADCQKCLRTSDIAELGDSTQLTFFEML